MALLVDVMQELGETMESMRQRSLGAARKALAHLAADESGVTFAGIGEWVNVTEAAVSHLVRRSRELEAFDGIYAGRMKSNRKRLIVGESV